MRVSQLADYPVRGFVVEVVEGGSSGASNASVSGAGLAALAQVVGEACCRMQVRYSGGHWALHV